VTHGPPPVMVRVVGVDISLTATGIASSLGWCKVVGRTAVTKAPLLIRMGMVDELCAAILRHVGVPDLVVIEGPAFSRTGGGALERHALWWLVVRSLIGRDIPVAEVSPPTRCRYATGKGAAQKTAVVDAVARRLPQYATHGNDNLCDAVILAAMGADWLGSPLTVMPKAHREALSVVRWPQVGTREETA
jgi:Holliday junction resolvasome RuvABC endonuclease subunit